jgi:hypothetical protein
MALGGKKSAPGCEDPPLTAPWFDDKKDPVFVITTPHVRRGDIVQWWDNNIIMVLSTKYHTKHTKLTKLITVTYLENDRVVSNNFYDWTNWLVLNRQS